MKKLIRRIKKRIHIIIKLIKWIPLLWEDRDFDYVFMLYILKRKLQNMVYNFEIDAKEYLVTDYDVSRIKLTIKLIDIVIEESYTSVIFEKMEHGPLETFSKRFDPFREESKIASKKQDKADKLLFKVIGHNYRSWWW